MVQMYPLHNVWDLKTEEGGKKSESGVRATRKHAEI
jgi:hypothetical protein